MPEHYDLEQIDTLSNEELYILCYDKFSEVYDHLVKNTTSKEILTWIRDIHPPLSKIQSSLESGYTTSPPRNLASLRIFLCHASEDKVSVKNLYQQLRIDGFNPWLDEIDILPGQEWQQEIPKAVRASDAILVCLSKNSIAKSGYVQKEIRYALDVAEEQPENTIFLIPLKLEECDVPERLSHLQWVDLFAEQGYDRLIQALQVRDRTLESFTESSPPLPQIRRSITTQERKDDPPKTIKRKALAIFRDPIWQMLGVIVAILGLGSALYSNMGSFFSEASPTFTHTPSSIQVITTNTPTKIISQSPTPTHTPTPDAEFYYALALDYLKDFEFELALENLDKTIELDPDNPVLYNERGGIRAYRGNQHSAIEDFDKAIDLNPSFANAYAARASAYAYRGDFDQAIKDINQAIDIGSSYAPFYEQRGTIYVQLGNLDKAFEDFNRALIISPTYAKTYTSRGVAYGIKGEFSLALADFNQALLIHSNDGWSYNYRGAIFAQMGEFDSAAEDFNQALTIYSSRVKSDVLEGLKFRDK